MQHPIEEVADEKPLPALAESDNQVQDSLVGALGRSVEQVLVPKDIVCHFVVTVDNLPRKKAAVQLWPVKPIGGELAVNDHSDRRHDERVIARLRRTDAKESTALRPLASALTRFDVYPRRLRRALTLINDGDHSMLAAPLKDSYHTVWFELHEELIILSGLRRADVDA